MRLRLPAQTSKKIGSGSEAALKVAAPAAPAPGSATKLLAQKSAKIPVWRISTGQVPTGNCVLTYLARYYRYYQGKAVCVKDSPRCFSGVLSHHLFCVFDFVLFMQVYSFEMAGEGEEEEEGEDDLTKTPIMKETQIIKAKATRDNFRLLF